MKCFHSKPSHWFRIGVQFNNEYHSIYTQQSYSFDIFKYEEQPNQICRIWRFWQFTKLALFGYVIEHDPKLDRRLFSHLLLLKAIFLDNNEIHILETRTFHSLTDLVTISFDNDSEKIADDAFHSLTNLTKLNLARNKLQSIDKIFNAW